MQSSFLRTPSLLGLATKPNARLTAADVPWLTSRHGAVIWYEPEIVRSFWCHRPLQPDLKTHTDLVAGGEVENIKQSVVFAVNTTARLP